jgi:WXG100 family type VII secretion target
MANVNVTFQDLMDQASRFDARRDEMTGLLDQLMAEVESLTSSGFTTDQASGAFMDSYEQFTSGTKEAVDGLTGMSMFLRRSSEILQEVDARLAAGIRI